MIKRRSHFKSRNGCLNCKKRHAKCDEQYPACVGCTVRDLVCVYPSSPDGRCGKLRPVPVHHQHYALPLASTMPVNFSLPIGMANPSPVAFSSIPQSNRLLELELMHRWTSQTWKAFHSVPDDFQFLHVSLPRVALEEEYVMNGLLSISAMDLAFHCYQQGGSSAKQKKYLLAAMEYDSKASAAFRERLPSIDGNDFLPAFYFGHSNALYNLLMPAPGLSCIDRHTACLSLCRGAFTAMEKYAMNWIQSSPPWYVDMMTALQGIQECDLPADTQLALGALREISTTVRVSTRGRRCASTGDRPKEAICYDVLFYRIMVDLLVICLKMRGNPAVRGLCVGVGTITGPPFLAALHEREPIALLIFMYYGVLTDELGREETGWWVGTSGQDLVREVCDLLQKSFIADLPAGRAAMEWAQVAVNRPKVITPISDIDTGFNRF
ncbi:hypothetical protein BX600DRAFT_296045 [Xylariales sp. PMI_506]|nr:hypothetical protein BX600DRAFT_296045 [Xylariales sp. PMI_506]